jgi:hypothetical protein
LEVERQRHGLAKNSRRGKTERWGDAEEEELAGSDLNRALSIAGSIERPWMPQRRILSMTRRWTREALAIPEVWRSVEAIAQTLLEHGEINGVGTVSPMCEPILGLWMRVPRWRRRLAMSERQP